MDDAHHAELRALQARAYGPGGRLDDGEQRRLHDLEARARDERRRPPFIDRAPESLVQPASAETPPPAPTVPAAVAADLRAARADGGHQPRTRRLLAGLVWAGSLAMVATLAVGITAAVSNRATAAEVTSPSGVEVTHVTTLSADTDRAWPEVLSAPPEDGQIFASLAGLTPILGRYDTGDGGMTRCVQLLPDEAWSASPEDGFSGAWYTSCAAEPFAPAASLIVSTTTPGSLRERFPIGTRLQFVLGDGVVEVYSADAPAGEAAG
ncbi:hypothetical protein [Microbacterium oleivorans]|uniref:ABC-type spermidine/putrescine transport system, permease component II n=1 Tax=Microbacterium oleivorans TaxID=273677 RepID=A0A031FVZ5_9MICO|nr:hypothetical protein [Microbacterium oleivorans]EZP28366.1 ABC-type spermidine/putrescine transport system, permease component II [Microbacterium oleivorans]